MKNQIYNAVYRLFEDGNYLLTITVGQVELKLYDKNPEDTNCVWDMGVTANGTPYTVGELFGSGLGPGNYAELFAGEYDIIQGLTDLIFEKEL